MATTKKTDRVGIGNDVEGLKRSDTAGGSGAGECEMSHFGKQFGILLKS